MNVQENMRFYEEARHVPQEAQKSFNNGSFSGTDINPMWRIKKMTEMFGPCGIGWYYEIISERAEEHHDMTMAIVDINLYIKVDGEWSKPIFGTGGNTLVKPTKSGQRASDEGYKMALTDALSVACKALGVGADIYFGADKTKYTRYAVDSEEAPESKIPDDVYVASKQSRLEKAAQRQMATPAQIETIMQLLPQDKLAAAIRKYGSHLEKMTAADAGKTLRFLHNQEQEYLENEAYIGRFDHDDAGDRL